MFSKTSEYALRAVFYIAHESMEGRISKIIDISENSDTPSYYLGKILQQLTKKKMLSSIKGPNGGFFFDKKSLKKICLIDIIDVFEGKDIFVKCGLGLENCGDLNPCPIHHLYQDVKLNLSTILQSTTIQEFVLDTKYKNIFRIKN